MNVLVTGANGFIGSNIVTKLRNNSKLITFNSINNVIANTISNTPIEQFSIIKSSVYSFLNNHYTIFKGARTEMHIMTFFNVGAK